MRTTTVTFQERVAQHQIDLRRRGFALSAEAAAPLFGQAALWYRDVAQRVPPSARHTARQIARFCGDDSQARITKRNLADAVGLANKAGYTTGYVYGGERILTDRGWLRVETVGRGRGSRTMYYLLPGDLDQEIVCNIVEMLDAAA